MTKKVFRPTLGLKAICLLIMIYGAAMLGPGTALAQNDPTRVQPNGPCSEKEVALDKALDAFGQRVQSAAEKASADEQGQLNDEAPKFPVTMSGKVTWHDKSFDVPGITMSLRRHVIVFKTPQVTMRDREMSFDVVTTKMETRTLMGKPELVCKKPWSCTYRSKPIKIDVPVVKSERKTIVTKVPEVAMQNTTTSFSIPSATVKMNRVSLKLPEFTVTCIQINDPRACDAEAEQRRAAAASQARMNALINKAQVEAGKDAVNPVHEFFVCQRDALQKQHRDVLEIYRTSTSQATATLNYIVGQGGKDTQEAADVRAAIIELEAKTQEQQKAFAETLKLLDDQEAQVLQGLQNFVNTPPAEAKQ